MAKSKYAPALFEVISSKDEKPSGKLSLPKWWRSKPTAASESQPAAGLQENPSSPAPAAPYGEDQPAQPVDGPADASPADPQLNLAMAPATVPEVQPAPVPARPSSISASELTDDPPPIFRVRDGRFELSLNTTNLAVATGILVICLFFAYQVGRGLGGSPSVGSEVAKKTDDLDAVRKGPATPAVLNIPAPSPAESRSGRSSAQAASPGTAVKPRAVAPPPAAPRSANTPAQVAPPAAPAAAPTPGQRIPGLTYVILETLDRKDRAEAEQLQQWLKSKNIETTIEPLGERLQLVSTQGFDYNNSTDRLKYEEFREIIKGLGKNYKAEFGSKARYSMKEPYGRKYNPR